MSRNVIQAAWNGSAWDFIRLSIKGNRVSQGERHKAIHQFTEAAQCAGKTGFPTIDLARGIVAKMRRRETGAPPTAYRCEHCGLYHVGTLPKAGR